MAGGWRYMAQRVDGSGSWGDFLDFDIPLQDVNIDEILSGHNGLTASITPEQQRLKAEDGRPLFEEWGTAIWAEAPGGAIYGGILTHSSFSGPNWEIECSDLSSALIGLPFTDAIHFENVDPLDLFRHVWYWMQGQPGGNLGVTIDATGSPIRLGTDLVQHVDFDLEPDVSEPEVAVPDDPETVPASVAPNPYKNNAAWRTAAVKQLKKNGWKESKADDALGEWLNGNGKLSTLSADEKKIVQAAIKHVGMPPNPPGGQKDATPTVNITPGTGVSSNFATNAAWKARGIKEMVKANWNEAKVDEALTAYLKNGAPGLSAEQSLILKRVVQKIGKPPNPKELDAPVVVDTSTGDPDPGPGEPGPVYEYDSYKLNWYTNHDLDSDLNDLAANTPFDWHLVHFWNGDELRHHIRLGYPRLGRRLDNLRFVFGENIDEIPTVERDGTEYASEVLVLGAGEGSSMIRGRAFRATPGRLRRVAVVTAPEITNLADANARAEAELAKRIRLDDISEIVLRDHSHAPMGSVSLGDEILLEGETGWVDVEMWVRVIGRSLSPDSGEAMTLTVLRSDRIG